MRSPLGRRCTASMRNDRPTYDRNARQARSSGFPGSEHGTFAKVILLYRNMLRNRIEIPDDAISISRLSIFVFERSLKNHPARSTDFLMSAHIFVVRMSFPSVRSSLRPQFENSRIPEDGTSRPANLPVPGGICIRMSEMTFDQASPRVIRNFLLLRPLTPAINTPMAARA